MPSSAVSSVSGVPAGAVRARGPIRVGRPALVLGLVAAVAVAASLGTGPDGVEADLARLLRFMALLKGLFAGAAFAAAWWRLARLARPARSWRGLVYAAAPGLMAGGAVALWRGAEAGAAALALHLGLFAFLAAALTDRDFIPDPRRLRAGRAVAAGRGGPRA
ncbi:hypothetical protein [Methylobacterium sp. A54F]